MIPQNLTTKEKLYLMSVKDTDGRAITMNLNYGLIGCGLFELVHLGKIKIENKTVTLLNTRLTNDPVLDLMIERISKTNKSKKLKHWITYFKMREEKIRLETRNMLYAKKYLAREEKNFLFIPYKLHPVFKTLEKGKILRHINKTILTANTFEEAESSLIAMCFVSGAFKPIFPDRSERKQARQKVKEMIKNGTIASSVNESIKEMQAAMIAIMAASAAVSSASH